jgi:hypothetical protein
MSVVMVLLLQQQLLLMMVMVVAVDLKEVLRLMNHLLLLLVT